MLVRTHPLAALLLIGTLLLSSCSSEEPEPKIAKEPSVAPTQAKEETAEEFIRRWNEASNRMLEGDSTEYRSLSPRCDPCIATADKVDGYYRDGGQVTGGPRAVQTVRPSPRYRDTKHMYAVGFKSPPSSVTESDGAEESSYPGGSFTNDVLLARSPSGWEIVSYGKVSE